MIDAMQHPMTQTIAAKFAILKPLLDERARRLWAAVEARALGRGGISQVAEATGLSRATVRAGLQELAPPATATGLQSPPGRLRRLGGDDHAARHDLCPLRQGASDLCDGSGDLGATPRCPTYRRPLCPYRRATVYPRLTVFLSRSADE